VFHLLFPATDDMSQGRREAFEVFRAEYPHNSNIEENKRTLKQRYNPLVCEFHQTTTSFN
jgi:hypothetical protein